MGISMHRKKTPLMVIAFATLILVLLPVIGFRGWDPGEKSR